MTSALLSDSHWATMRADYLFASQSEYEAPWYAVWNDLFIMLRCCVQIHEQQAISICPQPRLDNKPIVTSEDQDVSPWLSFRTPDFAAFVLRHGPGSAIQRIVLFLSEGKPNTIMVDGVKGPRAEEIAQKLLGSPDSQNQRREQAKLVFERELGTNSVWILGFSGPWWNLYEIPRKDNDTPIQPGDRPRLAKSQRTVHTQQHSSSDEYGPTAEQASSSSLPYGPPASPEKRKSFKRSSAARRAATRPLAPTTYESDSDDDSPRLMEYKQRADVVFHIFEGQDVDGKVVNRDLVSCLGRIVEDANFKLVDWK